MSSKDVPTASGASFSEIDELAPRKWRMPRWAGDILFPLLALAVIVGVWELACRQFGIPVFLLPAPSAIWDAMVQNFGLLVHHTTATTRTVALGFVASIVISVPLAVLIVSSTILANAIYPLLVLTQSIPKVALAPILVVLLGASEIPRVVVTFLVAFFPLVLSVAAGLNAVPPELLELGRACRASRWKELTRIRLPYAVPFIFSGLKAAITLSVVGAVVAEFVNADRGLGYLIVTSTAFFETPTAWAALIVLSVMGIILFQLVVLTETIFFPWAVTANQ